MKKNDIGTIIRYTIKNTQGVLVDLSTASVKQIRLRKPSGGLLLKTATFTTDGTNGQIEYAAMAGDLDEVGWWTGEGFVSLPSGSWTSSTDKFLVEDIME